MYARKIWDVVPVEHPWKLVMSGIALFGSSLAISWLYLPERCTWVIGCNIVILILYGGPLSSTWWTKNWTIAYVCSTPILFGWWAGSHPSPILPFALSSIFCLYWSKEIIKDIHDIRADHGIRVTLPIAFGIPGALRVSGVLAGLGTACITPLAFMRTLPLASTIPVTASIGLFGFVSWRLFMSTDPGRTNSLITAGSYCLIVGILMSRL